MCSTLFSLDRMWLFVFIKSNILLKITFQFRDWKQRAVYTLYKDDYWSGVGIKAKLSGLQ